MRRHLRKWHRGTIVKKTVQKKRTRNIRKNNNLSLVAGFYNRGFDTGFDTGYNEALKKLNQMIDQMSSPAETEESKNAELEYKRGLYEGGDGIVDLILPDSDYLPEISIRQIIEAGVEKLRPLIRNFLSTMEVGEQIISAMDTHSPLSVVRLGDGELITLAQEVVMTEQQVRKDGDFLSYAGVQIPDLHARDQLANAITKASIVGIPVLRLAYFQQFAFTVFRAHGIDYRQLNLTSSTINYTLYLDGMLSKILSNRKVLIVGNTADELSNVLSSSGVQVSGVVSPVNGVGDIPRVMAEIATFDYDIAIVGAGIPAVIIVQRIASEYGKVAIDFGHLADSFIKGEAVL